MLTLSSILVGAPFQLSRRFRARHIVLHRRIGRLVLGTGVAAESFAIVLGTPFPFGGRFEASAAVVFRAYLAATLLAFWPSSVLHALAAGPSGETVRSPVT